MKSIVSVIVSCFFLLVVGSCSQKPAPSAPSSSSRSVVTSIGPYAYLIKEIAKDAVDCKTLVPSNANPHLFEPSPQQAKILADADIWFQSGERFEEKIEHSLPRSTRTHIVHLLSGVALRQEGCCHHHDHDHAADLHVWMNPVLLKQISITVYETLIKTYPDQEASFTANFSQLQQKLDRVDATVEAMLATLPKRTLVVSHPAFGYFCDRYRLTQLSIEQEGKDPRPEQITTLLNASKAASVAAILLQKQYNNKGAKLVAHELKMPTFEIDPYAPQYEDMMIELAAVIASLSTP